MAKHRQGSRQGKTQPGQQGQGKTQPGQQGQGKTQPGQQGQGKTERGSRDGARQSQGSRDRAIKTQRRCVGRGGGELGQDIVRAVATGQKGKGSEWQQEEGKKRAWSVYCF